MPTKKATRPGRSAKKKGAAPSPLVLKRETVADLQAMLKQATRVRQSKKVCIA
jgi:hypothetical protein